MCFHLISVYPNPIGAVLNISGLSKNATLRLVDKTGKVIISKQINTTSESLQVAYLKSGIYILGLDPFILNSKSTLTSKLLVLIVPHSIMI